MLLDASKKKGARSARARRSQIRPQHGHLLKKKRTITQTHLAGRGAAPTTDQPINYHSSLDRGAPIGALLDQPEPAQGGASQSAIRRAMHDGYWGPPLARAVSRVVRSLPVRLVCQAVALFTKPRSHVTPLHRTGAAVWFRLNV